jgi:hypothetical protein
MLVGPHLSQELKWSPKVGPLTQQFRSARPQAVEIGCASMFYLYCLSLNPTQGAERFPKRRELAFCLWIIHCTADQNANASRLLCARG